MPGGTSSLSFITGTIRDMQLQLVVADLHLDRDALGAVPAGTLPRLSGLEAVLRWSRRPPAPPDWRAFVAASLGRGDLALLPPAQVVAAAAGIGQAATPWLAAPVHLVAGLDHLRLHAAGLLRLADVEQSTLVDAFNAAFGVDGLRLHAVPAGLLLTGSGATRARTQDPARYLGADLRSAPAQGEDASRLRRLGTEIEMWLHANAQVINRDRARRGALPVNALWLWGGGACAVDARQRDTGVALQAYAEDACVAGLGVLGGRPVLTPPVSFDVLCDSERTAGEIAPRLVCLSAVGTGSGDVPLARLDATWIAPAVAALREGRLSSLGLHVGGRQHQLRRADFWQFWRRSRPWWETLAA
jgi:hypothetical protein